MNDFIENAPACPWLFHKNSLQPHLETDRIIFSAMVLSGFFCGAVRRLLVMPPGGGGGSRATGTFQVIRPCQPEPFADPSLRRFFAKSSPLKKFTKTAASVKTRVQRIHHLLKKVDSGFRRNEEKAHFSDPLRKHYA